MVDRVRDFSLLVKLRLSLLVLASALAGYWMASPAMNAARLLFFAAGTFLVIAGANALNEIAEKREDGMMRRTACRPLPAGRMGVREALWLASSMAGTGLLLLAWKANMMTAGLALLALSLYLLAYTPLKKVSPWCVLVGAFPGALPALMGPAAAQGHVTLLGLLLFGIVFLWQFPHFLAIAWMAREDYERAGFKVLPFPQGGRLAAYEMLLGAVGLLLVAPLLTLLQQTGITYFLGSLLLGLLLLGYALRFWFKLSRAFAGQLMGVALLYLPVLFLLMILDRAPW